jgi:hypothetical protein
MFETCSDLGRPIEIEVELSAILSAFDASEFRGKLIRIKLRALPGNFSGF